MGDIYRRDFLNGVANLLVGMQIAASPLEIIAQERIFHSIPPIKSGTNYALFREANGNDLLDNMDALVGQYDTSSDAFNALKLAAVPNSSMNRTHYLVGNGKILALTQDYNFGFGGRDALAFSREKKIAVYVHAVSMNDDGSIKSDSLITTSYFFLDEEFAKHTKPEGCTIIEITDGILSQIK